MVIVGGGIVGAACAAELSSARLRILVIDAGKVGCGTTGAHELFLPFPGWILPNMMGIGGTQALLKAGMPVKRLRVVVGGSGPLLFAVAASLAKAGAKIVCVAEQTSGMQLAKFALGTLRYQPARMVQDTGYMLQYFPAPYWPNTWSRRLGEIRKLERLS